MTQESAYKIAEAYKFCRDFTKRNNENFPIINFFVSKAKKNHIAAFYTFARTADNIADDPGLNINERKFKLDQIESSLIECYQGKASEPLFIALYDTVITCHISIELLLDLLTAFKIDLVKNRYKDFDELLHYAKYSANPIGRVLSLIFGYNDAKLFFYTDKISTSLQLVDFWQDVKSDLKRDRIYLPLNELHKFHLTEDDIQNQIYNKNFRDLMSLLAKKTEKILYSSKPLFKLIPNKELNFYAKLIWLSCNEVLILLEKSDYNVFTKKPTINRMTKIYLLLKAFFFKF